MANNHGQVATHAHSLPSFNQAFSAHSLSNIPTNSNALPPIQSRIASSYRLDSPRSRLPDEDPDDSKPPSRKRSAASRDDDDDDDPPHIKQEHEHDSVEYHHRQHSPPLDKAADPRMPLDDNGPPPSPSTASPMKKRRVTVSGAPHALNTDIRPTVDQTNSTPISPVVMGFTINREDPAALEQVRSMISVKQKQKALIEQRRGSLVGASSSNSNPPPPPPLHEERISAAAGKAPLPPRSSRRSPNTHTNTTARRIGQPAGNTRPPSPTPMMIPAHPSSQNPAPAQALPFPPISFARRRAGLLGAGGKKKPADILISPREAQSSDQFQPAIQSAPPIPHAGQGSFQAARFSMALPRLPPAMGATDNIRRVASNVPPTPTRFSLLRPPATAAAATTPMISVSGRSPSAPNVPIASSLVPPTPAALKHPGYSGDKSAFLAPFEIFYDALNDSKQLKVWLSEQLQRSNALVQTLTQQQEKLNETIEAAVEKRVSGMRTEIIGLRRRVDELEDALRNSSDMAPGLAKGKQPLRNGSGGPPDPYIFPPPSHDLSSRHRSESSLRRGPSPSWVQERDVRGSALPPPPPTHSTHSGDSDRHASPPYDSRRLATVSATRLDPPPRAPEPPPHQQHHSSRPMNLPSPPQPYRDHSSSSSQNLAPIRGDAHTSRSRPGLTRQHSHTEGPLPSGGRSPNPHSLAPPTSSSAPSQQQSSQQLQQGSQSASSASSSASSRRPGSRRNSVVMSPPDGPGGESS
ncbi:hypothetical protein D9756_004774 [Leucocoprinus leucothites]|uniref:Uncharacterized protein n=1 Tax=Leucocoprinus leucothites TaxID=201217 RepID=A0A8H5G9K7_9AGAR|nr:hypothetical protein D9756_004774 [Leucoagaricus leucothites]